MFDPGQVLEMVRNELVQQTGLAPPKDLRLLSGRGYRDGALEALLESDAWDGGTSFHDAPPLRPGE